MKEATYNIELLNSNKTINKVMNKHFTFVLSKRAALILFHVLVGLTYLITLSFPFLFVTNFLKLLTVLSEVTR